MQTVRNRVADILGIDLPIVQAPMNYIAGHALAAAVSAAGGMGVLGPNAGKVQGEEISMRERTLREFARIREVTDKPVGINVVVPDGENKAALMYARSTVEAAAEGGATAAFCVGGLQPTIFELIKEKGMKLIVRPLTPTVKTPVKLRRWARTSLWQRVTMPAVFCRATTPERFHRADDC